MNILFQKVIAIIRFRLWMILNAPRFHYRFARSIRNVKGINILPSTATIDDICQNNLSVSRFGDGEFQMVQHFLNGGDSSSFEVDTFQHYDERLARRLNEILMNPVESLLVCVPYSLLHPRVYRGYETVFFEREWLTRSYWLMDRLKSRFKWGDTNFTRFYLHRRDINDYPQYICSLKRIWDKKDILIVEGEYSRLGVGNDLFDNASSVKRILCPPTDAFKQYDNILDSVKKLYGNRLVLIALGHTATVLAYDLALSGIRALDLGHIDIEYEWYRMGAKEKVPVPSKYVNEVKDGREMNSILDMKYTAQIVEVIS